MGKDIFKCEKNTLYHTFATDRGNNCFYVGNYRPGKSFTKVIFCGFCQEVDFWLRLSG
jgi:hypothetical protein